MVQNRPIIAKLQLAKFMELRRSTAPVLIVDKVFATGTRATATPVHLFHAGIITGDTVIQVARPLWVTKTAPAQGDAATGPS